MTSLDCYNATERSYVKIMEGSEVDIWDAGDQDEREAEFWFSPEMISVQVLTFLAEHPYVVTALGAGALVAAVLLTPPPVKALAAGAFLLGLGLAVVGDQASV